MKSGATSPTSRAAVADRRRYDGAGDGAVVVAAGDRDPGDGADHEHDATANAGEDPPGPARTARSGSSDGAEEGVDGNGGEEEREVGVREREQPYGLRRRGVARQADRLAR